MFLELVPELGKVRLRGIAVDVGPPAWRNVLPELLNDRQDSSAVPYDRVGQRPCPGRRGDEALLGAEAKCSYPVIPVKPSCNHLWRDSCCRGCGTCALFETGGVCGTGVNWRDGVRAGATPLKCSVVRMARTHKLSRSESWQAQHFRMAKCGFQCMWF